MSVLVVGFGILEINDEDFGVQDVFIQLNQLTNAINIILLVWVIQLLRAFLFVFLTNSHKWRLLLKQFDIYKAKFFSLSIYWSFGDL